MSELLDLPFEILTKCAQDLALLQGPQVTSKSHLLNFARSNKYLSQIAIPVLYETLVYNAWHGHYADLLQKYILSLYSSPLLAPFIREVKLHHWMWPAYHELWQDLAKSTSEIIYSPQTLGTFICANATRLRILDIEYPLDGTFLNFHSETVEILRVRPVSNPWLEDPGNDMALEFPVEGILKVDFLPHVLLWPKLTKLSIEGTSIFGEDGLLNGRVELQAAGSSSIVDLELRPGNFNEEAMTSLIHACRTLNSFRYAPPTSEDVSDEWDMGSYADRLPRTSKIASALQFHRLTLERITISRAGSEWDSNLDRFGPLNDFTALKTVEIDATMLLGWNHCVHNSIGGDEEFLHTSQLNPWMLATMLPPRVENVTLVIDYQPLGDNVGTHVITMLEGVAAEIREGRLTSLKSLQVKPSKCSYCNLCARSLRLRDKKGSKWQVNIACDDMVRVQDLLGRLGCILSI